MTIQVTKEPINLREKLNELETNKGLKGNEILQAETAQEVRSLIGAGRKNLIINGGFDVWQRGTSFTTGFSADRWELALSGGTATVTRQTFSVGQTDVPFNPNYFLRCSTSIGNDAGRIEQKIEGVAITSGQNITISFYAKGTNPGGGSFEIRLGQYFGTGGSADIDRAASDNFTVTSSWQKFTRTITVPSISGRTLGVGNNLDVMFEQSWAIDTSTAAWELDIANVQLELGSVATDFEHRSYGEELALCQRYYEKNTYGLLQTIMTNNYSTTQTKMPFMQTKRVAPTFTVYSAASGTAGNVSSYTSAAYTAEKAIPVVVGGVDSYVLSIGSEVAGTIYNWHYSYTADAEL